MCLRLRPLLIALITTSVFFACSDSTRSSPVPPRSGAAAERRILVRHRDGASSDRKAVLRAKVGGVRVGAFEALVPGLEVWELGDGEDRAKVLAALNGDPDIAYAEPDTVRHASVQPGDPHFIDGSLWGLHNTGQDGGVDDADIDAPEAWEVTTGSAEVVVGVVDTGIDLTHPDLAANLWRNPGEIPDNLLDDDQNGYIDDVHGWNGIRRNGNPQDDNSHGSHVSGTIGAVGNNDAGVVGVAWNVRLMALKFLDSGGRGYDSDAIAVLEYAVAQKRRGVNLRVLSNSWGGGGGGGALLDAIRAAAAEDILFVAAAGNDGIGNPSYPAKFAEPNIVSVAATTRTDSLADFSNYGATDVHLGAPGKDTLSTTTYGGYYPMSGTSMATPHVSGAAVLLLAKNDTLTYAEVKAALLAGVDPIPALANRTTTGGRLNAAKALANVPLPPPGFRLAVSPEQLTVQQEQAAQFTISTRAVQGFSGEVALSVEAEPALPGATITISPASVAAGSTATLTIATTLPTMPREYLLTVRGTSGDQTETRPLPLIVEPRGMLTFTYENLDDVPIPDGPDGGAGISTIDVLETYQVYRVHTDVDVRHWSQELRVRVQSPSGTEALLHDGTGGYTFLERRYALDTFRGEPMSGAWKLDARDLTQWTTGVISGWRLTVQTFSGEPDTIAPVVKVTAPAADAVIATAVTLAADATDDRAIRVVEFFVDGAPVGADATAPYSVRWEPSAAVDGPHVVHAVARDHSGNSTASAAVPVTLAYDRVPPQVVISEPLAGATVASWVTIRAAFDDASPIARVEHHVDGAQVYQSGASPFLGHWNSRRAANGTHTVVVKAFDVNGNVGESAPVVVTSDNDFDPPVVVFTAPAAGAVVEGEVTLTLATTDRSEVSFVEFYDGDRYLGWDSDPPFSLPWNTRRDALNGPHTLRARVWDIWSQVGSGTVEVVVDNDYVPPVVGVTAPWPATLLSGPFRIDAAVTDDRGVKRVDFFLDAEVLGSVESPPYQLQVDPRAVPDGPGELLVRAFDLAGNEAATKVPLTLVNGGTALRSEELGAPACLLLGVRCHSGKLLDGVHASEPGYPNTLRSSACVDGRGSYHWNESMDRLSVQTVDGAPFAAGATVEVRARVWANYYYFASDRLELFHAADATAPVWTRLATLTPPAHSSQELTTRFTLPEGELQAIRAVFSQSDGQMPCSSNSDWQWYVDRDDLAFAVGPDTVPPVVRISAPQPGDGVAGTVLVRADITEARGLRGVRFYDGTTLLGEDGTRPYELSWNTRQAPNGAHVLTVRAQDLAFHETTSEPVAVSVVNDLSAPTVAFSSPVTDASVSQTVVLTVQAEDAQGVAWVDVHDGETLIGSDSEPPYVVSWNTAAVEDGPHRLVASAVDGSGNRGSATITVVVENHAALDPILGVPRCSAFASQCTSGTYLTGRGTMGPEYAAPSTILGVCADGNLGMFHTDESLDRLTVTTLDGAPLAEGALVRIEARVWAFSNGSDRLDLFHAANAAAPQWQYLATLAPAAWGAQTLTTTLVLPAGGLQAIRGNFRYGGSVSACSGGIYDDVDDLAFAVAP